MVNERNKRKEIGCETRDLIRKIRDTKGTFHAKIGSIKNRNGRDLPDAEDSKKWWQEYTEFSSVQLLSRVRLFTTPRTAACQDSLFITNCRSLPKPMSTESVMPSNHLILCRPLLLLPSIFPSIRVFFSKKSALCIMWPKYWKLQLQHQSF